ncbi:MAG: DNA-directed RNA polymerase subunit beta, partial [Clostridiales bacterium]|nr:DNA-directed RNA polymerase subunit beta [Clostridiales bacterium]
GRVRTYEAIVKGHNVPKPGVPEAFKVLVKELQALCLDIHILDKDGNEVELKDDDDEPDYQSIRRLEEDDYDYSDSDREYEHHGFTTGTMDEDGSVISDVAFEDEGELSIDSDSSELDYDE